MSFGLQSLFFWAVFLQRRTLAEGLIGIATGPKAPGRDASLKLLSIYAGGRIAGRLSRPLRRGTRSVSGRAGQSVGGGSGGGGSDRRGAPRLGASHSRPVGGDTPSADAPGSARRSRSAAPTGDAGKGAPDAQARDSTGGPDAPDASATGAGRQAQAPRPGRPAGLRCAARCALGEGAAVGASRHARGQARRRAAADPQSRACDPA